MISEKNWRSDSPTWPEEAVQWMSSQGDERHHEENMSIDAHEESGNAEFNVQREIERLHREMTRLEGREEVRDQQQFHVITEFQKAICKTECMGMALDWRIEALETATSRDVMHRAHNIAKEEGRYREMIDEINMEREELKHERQERQTCQAQEEQLRNRMKVEQEELKQERQGQEEQLEQARLREEQLKHEC